jgi:hypothetical protein
MPTATAPKGRRPQHHKKELIMMEFQQSGYGQQQFQPQGMIGGGFGGQIGQGGGGISQFLEQHPLLQQIAQHPVLARQFLASHPLLQQALQNPQAAQQLVQQYPMLQQALQHPLLAQTVMQAHPMLQQALQQQLLQQLQQLQQQQQQQQPQQFQQPGGGQGISPQGWFGNLVSQFAQPAGGALGGLLGNQGIGSAIGGAVGQLGQMLPFGADPYSSWLQQQAIAAQYRGGMQQFQPGQGGMYGGQPGQPAGQTIH